MRVLITGAAGYVGSILIQALQVIDGVDAIVGIDLKPQPDRLAAATKVAWIQADVSTADWQTAARAQRVNAVVHLAFQIRQLFGRREEMQRRWNIVGARKATDLASLLGKRVITIPPVLLRALFALCWWISGGSLPTPRGAWKFLTYPIAVDGSSLTQTYNYRYQFSSADALMARAGRHLAVVATPAVERQGGEPNVKSIP